MSKKTDELGRRGERAAEEYLSSRGLTVIDRNWRSGRAGEIDLIMCDAEQVIFVEVRTRMGGPEAVQDAITTQKLRRLQKLAMDWLRAAPDFHPYRIDLVGVAPNRARTLADLFWWKGVDR